MTATVLPIRALDLLVNGDPEATALVATAGKRVTYGDLRRLVEQRRVELGLRDRCLVVLAANNSIEFVTTYLAVLVGGHVPLLAGSHVASLADAWDADAVVCAGPAGTTIDRRGGSPRPLHPDLALLLSTSGSTGAPKLVRLSHDNVESNATAIGQYLGLNRHDVGITTLPLHYCYGLSVLHSHLLAGASVLLTEASVVDRCFAEALRTHRITNVAGVPHTFELLERAGPEIIRTDSMRFVTVAGGRMAPERVTTWLDRGDRWGVDFYVMYGQTEATARMAYLPPMLARVRPAAIGVPVPGGAIELRPIDGAPDGTGEIVYRGPNVMLGYASSAADLAQGPTIDELRTGDIGRYHGGDGVYEIIGRKSRFVKPFGLRVDLDAMESQLARAGIEAAVTGDDDRLVVCVPGAEPELVRRHVAGLAGLPGSLIAVDRGLIPRTSTGKVDYEAIIGRVPPATPAEALAGASVANMFSAVLGIVDVAPTSTFVALGGDSLTYVECSLQLERLLGQLPSDWHLRPVAELESMTRRQQSARRQMSRIDTTVLLRAVGICAVVSTHMFLVWFPGGSHILLAIAGYNLSRFQLAVDGTRQRVGAGLRTAARVAAPAVIWTAGCMVLVGGYGWATLALVNNNIGPPGHAGGRWHYWFTEVFVQVTVAATLLLAVPVIRRWERRAPYLFALAVFAAMLVFRYRWIEFGAVTNLRFRTHGVAWFFVLGWLAHQSTTRTKQIATTVLCAATIKEFFAGTDREWFIALGIIAVVWMRTVPLPRPVIRVVTAVAGASMWIYLSHFRVFPPLDRLLPRELAFALTIAAGVAIWQLTAHAGRLVDRVRVAWRRRERRVVQPALAAALD